MNYWLVKSEPGVYSFDQLLKDKRTVWDGIRNYASRLNLRAMKKGDRVLFYHSNEGTAVVGIAEVVKEAYQDPSTSDDWSAVDIKVVRALKNPVTLATLKSDGAFADMDLVRLGRLSVQKVKPKEWEGVMELAGES